MEETCENPLISQVCGQVCVTSATCDDGNACTTDLCINGLCQNAPKDCDDGLVCTLDYCDPDSLLCKHEAYPGCEEFCTSDAECADSDVCTTDECVLNEDGLGTCAYTPILLPGGQLCIDCQAGGLAACEAAANICQTSTCAPEGYCQFEIRSCHDEVICTTDVCDPEDGCQNRPSANDCDTGCNEDSDCEDGNPVRSTSVTNPSSTASSKLLSVMTATHVRWTTAIRTPVTACTKQTRSVRV